MAATITFGAYMAKRQEQENLARGEIIKLDLKRWRFAERERRLFEQAPHQLPTWRLANFGRKTLASLAEQLSERIPQEPRGLIEKLAAKRAAELASIQLAALVVRNIGGILTLVGCGHEREALTLGRVNAEALIRGRQLTDDTSGHVARNLLLGRRASSLKAAAARYGSEQDIEFLDRFAHADLLSLRAVSVMRDNGIDFDVQILPQRGGVQPATQLLEAGRHGAAFTSVLVDIFGVSYEMPRFLKEQIAYYQDHSLEGL